MTLPVWLQGGPAQAVYDKYLDKPLLRDLYVQQVRDAWCQPGHPCLALYCHVAMQDSSFGSVPCVAFTCSDVVDGRAVLYLHGGSWMTGLSGKHKAWAKRLCAELNVNVYALDYRLAPEYPFPAALEDCAEALARLQSQYREVIVLGDSAGGNLAAALCHYCSDQNKRLPEAIVPLCPMMDMHMERYASVIEYGIANPLADMSLLAFQRFCYVPDSSLWRSAYVSPIYGDLAVLPKTLLISAGHDALRDDNLAFADACLQAGVDIDSYCFDAMPHSFFTHPNELPDQSKQVVDLIGQWLLS